MTDVFDGSIFRRAGNSSLDRAGKPSLVPRLYSHKGAHPTMANFCSSCGMSLFDGQFACPNCAQRRAQGESEKKRQEMSKNSKSGSCFVATVAFGDPDCKELNILREFRDKKLARNIVGRAFIRWYYKNGEQLATWVDSRPIVKKSVRKILIRFVNKLQD